MVVATELQTKIRETVSIPTLPTTISQIQEIMGQADAGVADVAEIVAQDPPVPDTIVEAVEWHHFPRARLRLKPHVAVVVLADQVADAVQGRSLRSQGNADPALLALLKVPLKEKDEILRFAELCLESIEI